MPKTIAKDTALSEITLRRYEKPENFKGRDLIRKLCLSLGLLQPGDSRDIIVDILSVILKAKKELPDLILLDVMMATKTEGFDIARNLHDDSATKGIPVVMVTGIRRDMNLPFRFEPDPTWLPVKAVIEKPIKPEALLKIVEDNIKK